MQLWVTEIRAIDPTTSQMTTWGGPNVPGINLQDAEDYCQRNGLGYCKVMGRLIGEVPALFNDPAKPDWRKYIDYETPSLN